MSKYEIVQSKEMGEGQGANVKRLFPTRNYPAHYDPFVLLDEFFVESPASFPDHEHRGFEAVTYMLEGSFVHSDNLGNNSEVKEGGLQTFNAGKSLVHSEKPGETGFSHGIQLWVNLPKNKKNSEPTYQSIKQTKVIKDEEDIKIRKVLGDNISVKLNTEVDYYDIQLNNNASIQQYINDAHKGILYVVKGDLSISNLDENISSGTALLFEDLDQLEIKSENETRFVLITGKPLNQEIKIRGSFVE
ncbi:MAG: pirin family protein [Halanaerobiales bacterium]|nr:pirin family protein [Halanaerobiales bacterium]